MDKSKEVSLDILVRDLRQFLKSEHGIELPEDKFKGIAFSALKKVGKLSYKDRYKTYEHIAQICELFRENLGMEVFTWEDIEHITGNLFYAMRSLTRKSIDEINKFITAYEIKSKNGVTVDPKDVITDLFLLADLQRNVIYETWRYMEKTQLSGVGLFSSRILKLSIISTTDGQKSEENLG